MKYAITGHSRGIGKECFDLFTQDGHEVVGFSRSNGYDIRDPQARKQIIEQSLDADVFINNAAGYFLPEKSDISEEYRLQQNSIWDEEGYFPQTRMFMEIWEHFKDTQKTVVNVNSIIKHSFHTPTNQFLIVEPRNLPYLVTEETVWDSLPNKKSQQIYYRSKEQLFAVASKKVGYNNANGVQVLLPCRCININPGWVHTDMFPQFAEGKKLMPEDIAEVIKWTINIPKNIEIFDLSIRKKVSNKEAGLSTKGKDFTSIPPIKA